MNKITMHDTLLSIDVDLYQLGLPDPYGANALIFIDGVKNASALSANPQLSCYANKQLWHTININRLLPKN